ncbi:hypothetical protein HPB48_010324 [Haemaphysalis longicornis]|uniref:Uncharacterized protein n=1 Tax=Haemaphysalis longicornis TaxID=44386 RepID=A0A9J6FTE3_HAELO|nr:hypothetical protein HPB48_010324 [Haemaphysalis longicornis]
MDLTRKKTSQALQALLLANRAELLHARIMGRTTFALLTYQGPQAPFYAKVASLLYRYRPIRRSGLVCHMCGEVGHRHNRPKYFDCGLKDTLQDHHSTSTCKLCFFLIPLQEMTGQKTCTNNSENPNSTTSRKRRPTVYKLHHS